jgi:hypothetical protein
LALLITDEAAGGTKESLLVITGSMGAGKTSVLGEASDILTLRRIVHAAIDLDALGVGYLPTAAGNDAVMYENLRSVCENYAARGVRRFLVARAIEDQAQLELCRGVISAEHTIVCRLTAGLDAMQERIKKRERGPLQWEFVARVAELNGILDSARLEDITVTNEHRSANDAALEMLVKAGWISR